jgi:hypothetical protein
VQAAAVKAIAALSSNSVVRDDMRRVSGVWKLLYGIAERCQKTAPETFADTMTALANFATNKLNAEPIISLRGMSRLVQQNLLPDAQTHGGANKATATQCRCYVYAHRDDPRNLSLSRQNRHSTASSSSRPRTRPSLHSVNITRAELEAAAYMHKNTMGSNLSTQP